MKTAKIYIRRKLVWFRHGWRAGSKRVEWEIRSFCHSRGYLVIHFFHFFSDEEFALQRFVSRLWRKVKGGYQGMFILPMTKFFQTLWRTL